MADGPDGKRDCEETRNTIKINQSKNKKSINLLSIYKSVPFAALTDERIPNVPLVIPR
jgi:hypothetical protein